MLAYIQDKIVKIAIILLPTKITAIIVVKMSARFSFLIFFMKTGILGESL